MSELYDILKASNFSSSGGGDIDTSAYATALLMAINSDTYVLSSSLKNENGETLGTPQTIDLPLETMVVNGAYDNTTKKVILTLKNGNTVDFSVADLVDGLQSEITSSNKLDSDLVDDTNQNNKFVTSAEKTKIADALTAEVYNAGKQVNTGNNIGEIFNDYFRNVASGGFSHAEGKGTRASGHCSHAEGSGTTASGNYSHTEGSDTIAASDYQHVQGKYNVEDSNSKYAFIIGNGTNSNSRSNAFAVDWDGLIYVNNASTGVNVSQLQAVINSSNKLSADFVDDTNSPNKFVTSDEKTTWSAKQPALTSAQLTAVNSGIDSSKVSQIEKNSSALIDLIDSGQKNLVDAQNPSGQQRVTITKGTNGSAVISCSNATWATTAYHVYVTPNEDYKLLLYVDEADVSNVTFRCFTSAVDDDGAELEVLPRTEQITGTGVYILDINTQYNRIKISPNINNSATAGSGSATIRMMLCSKAAWDISQKYVPYRPSYDELVARITALENA